MIRETNRQLRNNAQLNTTQYIRYSDVIDVTVITRRHVSGILNLNTDGANMRKYENSCPKVICGLCITINV